MAVFVQEILKYLLARPGAVVYRDEIAQDTGLEARQVSAGVLRLQKDTPVGSEIETIMRGNAWRYRPNQPAVDATSNGHVPMTPRELPLTTLIRMCLIENAHKPVTVDDLVSYTSAQPHQVKVGVNNMRRISANNDVTPYVVTLVPGQAWRFEPPVNWRPYGERPSPSYAPRPAVPPSRPTVVEATVRDDGDDRSSVLRTFEEVGTAGDAIIIRCDADGAMYRAVPLT